MLRLILFVGTNLAIMLVLSVVVSLFGLDRWAYTHAGINLQGMLILCAVFGMGGSFRRLFLISFAFGCGVLLGAVVSLGYWGCFLETHFGNPFFPLMNSVFRSPEFNIESSRAFRFIQCLLPFASREGESRRRKV